SGAAYDAAGNPLELNAPSLPLPEQPHHDMPTYPFRSIAEFKLADCNESPFEDIKHLYKLINSIPHGNIPWEQLDIFYQGDLTVLWMKKKWEVWYHDSLKVMEIQIANPEFCCKMDFAPKWVHDGKMGSQLYKDLMSRTWAWDQANILTENPDNHGSMFAPIVLGSDKTTVSVATGQNDYYPLYALLGNLQNDACHSHSNTMTIISFLTIPKADKEYENSAEFHKFPYMEHPKLMYCGDGVWQKVIYGISPYIADYPEQYMLAAVVQGWCTKYVLTNIHKLLAPDLLHQLIKETFKDHLVDWVITYIEKTYDEKEATTPCFPGLQHSADGHNFKQWTGNNSKVLMKTQWRALQEPYLTSMVTISLGCIEARFKVIIGMDIEQQIQNYKVQETEVIKGLNDLSKEFRENDGLVQYQERIYIPPGDNLQSQIIQEFHNAPDAGHLGQHQTLVTTRTNELTFGDGSLATLGKQHRKQRKMLNPAFSIAHMRERTPIFYEVTSRLHKAILEQVQTSPKEIDILHWMTRIALELIGQSGMGYSFDSLKIENGNDELRPYSRFVKRFGGLLSGPKLFVLASYIFPITNQIKFQKLKRWIVDRLPLGWEQDLTEIVDVMHETAIDICKTKQKAIEEGHGDDGKKDIISILRNLQQLFGQYGWKFYYDTLKRYGSVTKIKGLFGENMLLIFDPKALHHILIKDQHVYEEAAAFIASNKIMYGNGLLSVLGEQHRKQRKLLNPVFSIAHLHEMTPIVYEVTHRLRQALLNQVKDGPKQVDILDWLSRTALELIGQCGMGYSFDSLKDDSTNAELHPYRRSVNRFTGLVASPGYIFMCNYLFPLADQFNFPRVKRWIVEHTPSQWVQDMKNIADMMEETAREICKSKQEAILKGESNGREKDIISILMRANATAGEEDKLTDAEVVAQVATLTFAAMDSTSSALSRILWLLTTRPDVQEKLHTELLEAKRNNGGDELPYNQLVTLPYLDAVCRETLRLYPPLGTSSRTYGFCKFPSRSPTSHVNSNFL
ncbi:Cytochrome P450 3A41, partial [Leucoagaricus sp. SymC.cos]